jgi:hypothetical protein
VARIANPSYRYIAENKVHPLTHLAIAQPLKKAKFSK